MNKSKFPKTEKQQQNMLEAFKHIFEHIASLEKRIQAMEVKIKSIILE